MRTSRGCLLVLYALVLLGFACLLYLIPGSPPVRYRLPVGWNSSNDSSLPHSLIPASPLPPQVSVVGSDDDEDCIRRFLVEYTRYCEGHLTKPGRFQPGNASHLCPCIPGGLVGIVLIDQSKNTTLDELESSLSFLRERGRWRPRECVARQRLAIIIPYVDRERHLRIFLNHMHRFLQRQLLDYSIFVIEQLAPELFNRAALMNVGFAEANSTDSFDCFIFHDIDQLPIDDRNFYSCSEVPRHVVGYRKKFNYHYAYSTSFGGGNSFTRQEFESINGYSNSFYGWGGEDDDLYQRTEAKKMRRTRYPRCIAKYDEIVHERDRRNPIGVDQYATLCVCLFVVLLKVV